MVGPFGDDHYFCIGKEYGYCDRRSGTCFCNTGYSGIDCSECSSTHFKLGSLCYPKKLCPNDCSGGGSCNYYSGTCECLPFRYGADCSLKLCSKFDPNCDQCTDNYCLVCSEGYSLSQDRLGCDPCTRFDARCLYCNFEYCLGCVDLALLSIKRSGLRSRLDQPLPIEEVNRQFSYALPFGTQAPEYFDESEPYVVAVPQGGRPLSENAKVCAQGKNDDASIQCWSTVTSNVICGHTGTISFSSPEYAIAENAGTLNVTVTRTGGGVGRVTVDFNIAHVSTNASDVHPSTFYTTDQTIVFDEGVISYSFQVTVTDDREYEGDEVFTLVLSNPTNGATVGPTYRANVTILDDDADRASGSTSFATPFLVSGVAGTALHTVITSKTASGGWRKTGGDLYFGYVETELQDMQRVNSLSIDSNPLIGYSEGHRAISRSNAYIFDRGNGTYDVSVRVDHQGNHTLRLYLAQQGGLRGSYYSDAYMIKEEYNRIDSVVNFTWGAGQVTEGLSDFISVRWDGLLLPDITGDYVFRLDCDDGCRLWLDSQLVIDAWDYPTDMTRPSDYSKVVIHLLANKFVDIIVEYRELRNDATMRLLWTRPSSTTASPTRAPTGTVTAAPTAVWQLPEVVIPSKYLYVKHEIASSPHEVYVVSSLTDPVTTECSGDGLMTATVGVPATFNVCPRDEFGNMRDDDDHNVLSWQRFEGQLYLTSTDWLSPFGVPDNSFEGLRRIPVYFDYDISSSCFIGTYTPDVAGTYQLNVTFNDWWGTNPAASYSWPPPSFGVQTIVPVRGSPFIVTISPGDTSASQTDVYSIPTTGVAGFHGELFIKARDSRGNLVYRGGDNFQVYLIHENLLSSGINKPATSSDYSVEPDISLSGGWAWYDGGDFDADSLVFMSGAGNGPDGKSSRQGLVRGEIVDWNNGNYTAHFRPLITGNYYIRVTLDGIPVAMDNVAETSRPYVVSNDVAFGATCTATGTGLTEARINYASTFTITIRDAWGNLVVDSSPRYVVQADLTPPDNSTDFGYQTVSLTYVSGSIWKGTYTPKYAGYNMLKVKVNGVYIYGSPFVVDVQESITSGSSSYAYGDGLSSSIAGEEKLITVTAYDLYDNKRVTSNGAFVLGIMNDDSLLSNITYWSMFYDNQDGTYSTKYTIERAGTYTLSIAHVTDTTIISAFNSSTEPTTLSTLISSSGSTFEHVVNSPFTVTVIPSTIADADTSFTTGSNMNSGMTGVLSTVRIDLGDSYNNHIITNGDMLRMRIMRRSEYYPISYEHDDYSDSDFIDPSISARNVYPVSYPLILNGSITSVSNGVYTASYTPTISGEYETSVELLEYGLNVTFYTTLDYRFPIYTAIESQPLMNDGTHPHVLNKDIILPVRGFSAIWSGYIFPPNDISDTVTFYLESNIDAEVNVILGADIITDTTFTPIDGIEILNNKENKLSSLYTFSNSNPVTIRVAYSSAHSDGSNNLLKLHWSSVSIGEKTLIPSSQFKTWQNITVTGTTIEHNVLSSSKSIAIGDGITSAVAGTIATFTVVTIDAYGNPLRSGGESIKALLLDNRGIAQTSTVVDNNDGTYTVSYYPTIAGTNRLLVTAGCCLLHVDVGVPSLINSAKSISISGSPFIVKISSSSPDITRFMTLGSNHQYTIAGENRNITLLLRDSFDNTVSISNLDDFELEIKKYDTDGPLLQLNRGIRLNVPSGLDSSYNDETLPNIAGWYDINYTSDVLNSSIIITYMIPISGDYSISIKYQNKAIVGYPSALVVHASETYANLTTARGFHLHQARVNHDATFIIEARDKYGNSQTSGGDRFWVRLYNNVFSAIEGKIIDLGYGLYRVMYTPEVSGPYSMNIHLLHRSPTSRGGGGGLTGEYYTSSDLAGIPEITRNDEIIHYFWGNDPTVRNNKVNNDPDSIYPRVPFSSVRWSGYLAPSVNDVCIFSITSNQLVRLFIEENLVASRLDLTSSTIVYSDYVSLTATVPARIRIELERRDSTLPTDISLKWKCLRTDESIIPSAFFYPSSSPINNSPYIVQVIGN